MHSLSGALPHRSSKFICDGLVGAGGPQHWERGTQVPEPTGTHRRQRGALHGQASSLPPPPARGKFGSGPEQPQDSGAAAAAATQPLLPDACSTSTPQLRVATPEHVARAAQRTCHQSSQFFIQPLESA